MTLGVITMSGPTVGRLAVAVFCAVAIGACAPTSTETLSADEIADEAERVAGPAGETYSLDAYVDPADGGKSGFITVFLACPPEEDCVLVGRDGETYSDMQALVDGSPEIEPGDEVYAVADATNPTADTEDVDLEIYRQSEGVSWGWYAGGGAVLLAVAGAVVLWLRRRRLGGQEPAGSAAEWHRSAGEGVGQSGLDARGGST
jgi:hypothetical protein